MDKTHVIRSGIPADAYVAIDMSKIPNNFKMIKSFNIKENYKVNGKQCVYNFYIYKKIGRKE